MGRHLTFRQYRAVDLALFALMLCLSETVIVHAARFWFPDQLYTVSVVGAMTAIVLMRWGGFAAIHALLGGVVFVLVSGGTAAQMMTYCIGNLFALGMLLPLRRLGAERIRNDGFLSVVFGLCTLLLMHAGRALCALVLLSAGGACLGFFTTDALSYLFTGVILWIARRLDGIFEDQKHYLLRIHKAEEGKGGY
ncbi:MAG: hypothetical protein K6G54_00120 [Oscillospiraceae bacterium]|nr:hypothetical protein [Oscillospiraceae bacterium]